MVDRAYLDICIEICSPMMPLGAYIEGCRCISHEAQILRFAQNDSEKSLRMNVRPLRRTMYGVQKEVYLNRRTGQGKDQESFSKRLHGSDDGIRCAIYAETSCIEHYVVAADIQPLFSCVLPAMVGTAGVHPVDL